MKRNFDTMFNEGKECDILWPNDRCYSMMIFFEVKDRLKSKTIGICWVVDELELLIWKIQVEEYITSYQRVIRCNEEISLQYYQLLRDLRNMLWDKVQRSKT